MLSGYFLVQTTPLNQVFVSMHQTPQAVYWFLDAVAGSLANGLNAPLQYVTDFLHATGIKGKTNPLKYNVIYLNEFQ